MSIDSPPPSKKPPRAEPLQPDRPDRGDDVQSGGDPEAPDSPPTKTGRTDDSVRRQQKQSEDALKNVREGYD